MEAVIDRIVIKEDVEERLTESVESALRYGDGVLIAGFEGEDDRLYSESLSCSACGISFPALTPQSFSFNSPQGMCHDCNGLGTQVAFDPDLLIPDRSLTIREGALKSVGRIDNDSKSMGAIFHRQMFNHLKISLDKPWRKLSKAQQKTILYGTGDKRYKINWGNHGVHNQRYEGLVNRLMRRFRNTKSEGISAGTHNSWQIHLVKLVTESDCGESAAVRLNGITW